MNLSASSSGLVVSSDVGFQASIETAGYAGADW